MKREKDKEKKNMWLSALRGAVVACAVSVALVAGYAFVLLKQWMPKESITAANIVIKLVCAAAAALLALRGCKEKAPLRGAAAGAFFMLISTAVFSLLSGSFGFETGMLIDIAMCAAAGLTAGMVKNIAA